MPPEDLITALEKRPFEPFRVYLTDGTVYEVRHPDLMMVGRHSAIIGFAASIDQPRPLYDRYTTITLLHIVRVEPTDGVPKTK